MARPDWGEYYRFAPETSHARKEAVGVVKYNSEETAL